MTDTLAKRIEILLTPILGELMAAATLKIQTEKLGLKQEDLSAPDLPSLAKNIQKALTIFVGSDKATEVARGIEKIAI
jgi:hypothetical protein